MFVSVPVGVIANKPLLIDGYCTVAYFVVVDWQRVYMPIQMQIDDNTLCF
jgi:hypothetical protein